MAAAMTQAPDATPSPFASTLALKNIRRERERAREIERVDQTHPKDPYRWSFTVGDIAAGQTPSILVLADIITLLVGADPFLDTAPPWKSFGFASFVSVMRCPQRLALALCWCRGSYSCGRQDMFEDPFVVS